MLLGGTHFFGEKNNKNSDLTKPDKTVKRKIGQTAKQLLHTFNQWVLSKEDVFPNIGIKRNIEQAAEQLLNAFKQWSLSKEDVFLYLSFDTNNQPDDFKSPNFLDNKKLTCINKSLDHIKKTESILQNTKDSLPFMPKLGTNAAKLLQEANKHAPNHDTELSMINKKNLQLIAKSLKKTLLKSKKNNNTNSMCNIM